MNFIAIKGNLTRDPDVKTVQTGGREVVVGNFTVGVSRYYNNKDGEKKEVTSFIPCVVWDRNAKRIAQFFHKGDPILLDGSLEQEKWESDGVKKSSFRIRVNNFEILKPKSVKKADVEKPQQKDEEKSSDFVETTTNTKEETVSF